MTAGSRASPVSTSAGYPSARRHDLVEELHGRQIADPYRWLENTDSAETREWVAAQQDLFSGALIAVQLSAGGTEDSELLVIDVETGTTVDGPIDRCRFSSIGWLADESGFYYVRRQDPSGFPAEEAAYHRRIRLRRCDRPPDEDPVVFGADRDKASIFSADADSSGRWLIVHSQVGTQHSNEVWLADLDVGETDHPGFVPVITDRDAETRAHIGDDGLRRALRSDQAALKASESEGPCQLDARQAVPTWAKPTRSYTLAESWSPAERKTSEHSCAASATSAAVSAAPSPRPR